MPRLTSVLRFLAFLGPATILLWLAACAPTDSRDATVLPAGGSSVDDAVLASADADEANWLTYGRTYSEQRFSPLTEISEQTVGRLGLAWSHDLGHKRGLEGTPLVKDGVLYATGTWSIIYALNAATGELLWTYDPQVPRGHARWACCDAVNRGPAFYRGKVYAGTLDGRLVAVTAETGELVWETKTTPEGSAYTITGAPRIARGRVLIGNGGAEFGVRGYVSAYDAETGEMAWRVYTVPGNPAEGFESEALEAAAETWSGEWWSAGGGGTAWDAIVYDPELDYVYIGVGNGSPWYSRIRSPDGGDNLFLSSILAVRAEDGEYVWHYQTTPGDNWDYTATQPLMLAELEIEGRERRVIMQAPKNGFFYVLDRETGEFLSGTPFTEITWAEGMGEDGRPIESTAARDLAGSTFVAPGPNGAHNWHPMSFNPGTGLVYFPVYDHDFPHAVDDEWSYDRAHYNIGLDWDELDFEGGQDPSGRLVAWDPVAGREVWRVEQPNPLSGGTLSTAGNLVFQGRADGTLRAYRATDGELLWAFDGETGIGAAPITYTVDGVQHVAVLAGWGGPEVLFNTPLGAGEVGPSRIMAFRLNGSATLPPAEPPLPPIAAPTFQLTAPADVEEGEELYALYCQRCHGVDVISAGGIPDLRRSTAETHGLFEAIVLGGARQALGMPAHGDVLSPEQVRQIQSYVLSRAREAASETQTADAEMANTETSHGG
jgi:PQQ-dependent dehydrogenase (methanol/ethanol family)